ncbi:MAG: 3-hydroxylacyl-ACP dehydratase [Treponema sp.]|jgi:predicted hotdog family 3-hydroxylacyl-ACP dehydratase|nr:3-hydroxylacyl-ACP dehydratase [Treponema sp.]
MALIEQDELITLVPHKGKMFLLSRVISYAFENRELAAEYDVTSNCLFYDAALDGIPSWVSFEFMAQCVSALSGLTGRLQGQGPKPGFILSVSGMELFRPVLYAGETVTASIEEDYCVDLVHTFKGEAAIDGSIVAKAKLTAIDVEDISVYKRENHAH